MKRVIKIVEQLQKIFTVEADSEEEAMDIVHQEYCDKCNIVLTADDYAVNDVEDITDEYTEKALAALPTIEQVTNGCTC